jgi:hypothetical protein
MGGRDFQVPWQTESIHAGCGKDKIATYFTRSRSQNHFTPKVLIHARESSLMTRKAAIETILE